MNVLGVCAPNMQFIYVLPGWEGSAHDVRVLRNALSRPHSFRVPRGNLYLYKKNYIVNKTHFNRPILTILKVIIIWLMGGIQIENQTLVKEV